MHLLWTEELLKFLSGYRATPHSSTKFAPFALLFGRHARTKLPSARTTVLEPEVWTRVRENDAISKTTMKTYAEQHRRIQESPLKVGDIVLVKQPHASKTTPKFDPEPMQIRGQV